MMTETCAECGDELDEDEDEIVRQKLAVKGTEQKTYHYTCYAGHE